MKFGLLFCIAKLLWYNQNMNIIRVKKVNNQIKALVASAVFDVFNDPDFGFDLSAKAKKRLSRSSENSKTVSLSKIKKLLPSGI